MGETQTLVSEQIWLGIPSPTNKYYLYKLVQFFVTSLNKLSDKKKKLIET